MTHIYICMKLHVNKHVYEIRKTQIFNYLNKKKDTRIPKYI